VTILVTVSGAGKTPRSFKGDVPEDAFRAEIRGYYLYPSNREWPRRSVMAQFDAEQPADGHSEGSFIGKESVFCQPAQQQIPRTAKACFGMTNLLGFQTALVPANL
jgi:hypothetical protein